jgi:hypothetical protein
MIATTPGTKIFRAASLGLLLLSGCNAIDPLKRPYMWHDSAANAHNIAAMAANPADLLHGRRSPKRRVSLDSDSVDRLWSGKTLPLTGGSAGGSGGSSGGGATPAAAGGT